MCTQIIWHYAWEHPLAKHPAVGWNQKLTVLAMAEDDTQDHPVKRDQYSYFSQDINNIEVQKDTNLPRYVKDATPEPPDTELDWRAIPLSPTDPGFSSDGEKNRRSRDSLVLAKDVAKTFFHST